MRTDQAVTIRRIDYTPPAFLVDRVALVFDLLPDDTRVESTLQLRRNPAADPRLTYRGEDVVRTLEQVCAQFGYPKTIRVDNVLAWEGFAV